MRSKFIISSLVAFIAAVGLMAAPALADFSVNGFHSMMFGNLSSDSGVEGEDATNQLNAYGRTQVVLAGSDGPLSGRTLLRFHHASTTTATMRHQVTWNTTDTLSLTIAPSHFGFAGAGVNTNPIYFVPPPIGNRAVDGTFNQYSVPVFKADMNLGGLAVGAGIVTVCNNCQGDVKDDDDQTIVLHAKGSAGAITYNAAFATGSATASATPDETTGEQAYVDESVSSSALQAGLTFDGGPWSIGFDFSNRTDTPPGEGDDTVYGFLGLGFNLGDSLGVAYHSETTTVGDADAVTRTNIDAVYKIMAGERSYYGVQFITDGTDNPNTEVTSSNTWIGFAMRVNY